MKNSDSGGAAEPPLLNEVIMKKYSTAKEARRRAIFDGRRILGERIILTFYFPIGQQIVVRIAENR